MIIVIILKYFLLMFLVSCILVQNWYNGSCYYMNVFGCLSLGVLKLKSRMRI